MQSRTGLPAAPSNNPSWGEHHWPLCLGNQSWGPQAFFHVTAETPIPTMPRHTNKGIVTSEPLGSPSYPGPRSGVRHELKAVGGQGRAGQGKRLHPLRASGLDWFGPFFPVQPLVLSRIHRELSQKTSAIELAAATTFPRHWTPWSPAIHAPSLPGHALDTQNPVQHPPT